MPHPNIEPVGLLCCRLDTAFLPEVFRHGCLAAAPGAANVVDPLIIRSREPQPGRPILFSDILDYQLREPRDILRMSNFAEGVKS